MGAIYETTAIDAALDDLCARLETEVQAGLDRVAGRGVADLWQSDAWNDRTGTLRASFVVNGEADFTRTVSTATPYAGFLEHGTSRIAPRKFMAHASTVIGEALAEEMNESVRRAFHG